MKKTDKYTINNTKPKCICCGKSIKPIYEKQQKDIPAESGMWNKAIVSVIAGGYGSAYDADVFLIALCDKCLSEAIKNEKIIHSHNYLFDYNSQEYKHG